MRDLLLIHFKYWKTVKKYIIFFYYCYNSGRDAGIENGWILNVKWKSHNYRDLIIPNNKDYVVFFVVVFFSDAVPNHSWLINILRFI